MNFRRQRHAATTELFLGHIGRPDDTQNILGETVRRHRLQLESFFESQMHFGRQQSHHQAQRVIAVIGSLRKTQKNLRDRAHDARGRDRVFAHLVPKTRCAEFLGQHYAAADRQHGDAGMAKRVDVKQRQDAQHSVVLIPAQALRPHARRKRVGVLGQHHPFGTIGGPGGVGNRCEILGIDGDLQIVIRSARRENPSTTTMSPCHPRR